MGFWSAAWADIPSSHYLAIALIVLSGGLVRGATGFGGAMVMTLPLSLIFKPSEAILTVLLLELAGPLTLLRTAWASVSAQAKAKQTLFIITGSALAILPLGIGLQNHLDRQSITVFMALAVLICALALIMRIPRHVQGTPLRASATGLTSGLMLALTGICGPPVVLYVHASEKNHQIARQFLMLYITAASVLMVATSAWMQPVGLTAFIYALTLTPVFFVGNLLGHQLTVRLNGLVTRLASLWLLVIGSGLYLLKTLL